MPPTLLLLLVVAICAVHAMIPCPGAGHTSQRSLQESAVKRRHYDATFGPSGRLVLSLSPSHQCHQQPCGRCEGSCANDHECVGSLRCFRTAGLVKPQVPGCSTSQLPRARARATGPRALNFCFDDSCPVQAGERSYDFYPNGYVEHCATSDSPQTGYRKGRHMICADAIWVDHGACEASSYDRWKALIFVLPCVILVGGALRHVRTQRELRELLAEGDLAPPLPSEGGGEQAQPRAVAAGHTICHPPPTSRAAAAATARRSAAKGPAVVAACAADATSGASRSASFQSVATVAAAPTAVEAQAARPPCAATRHRSDDPELTLTTVACPLPVLVAGTAGGDGGSDAAAAAGPHHPSPPLPRREGEVVAVEDFV